MARIRKEDKKNNYQNKWLIAGYLRLSLEDGEDVSKSIKSQKMIVENKINDLIDKGDNVILVDWFIDDGTSGTYDSREGFQEMLTGVEKGDINSIIVVDLSRAFRNDGDQKYYLEYYFRQKHIRFISCSLPEIDTFNNPNQIYDLDVKFHGMMNAWYPQETSKKIKSRLVARRKQGEFVAPFAPYGYKKSEEDKHILIIDENVNEIVEQIFNMFVYEGMSQRKIAERLNELGVLNPTAYKKSIGEKYKNPHAKNNSTLWSSSTIRNILQSQYYIGNLDQHHVRMEFGADKKYRVSLDYEDYKDQIYENAHDSIISKETFNLAQKLLARDTRQSPKEQKTYLFSGLLKCGDCKKSMVRATVGNNVYYHCSTYRKLSKLHCTKHTIREDVLIKIVLQSLQAQIALAVSMSEQIDKINKSGIVNNTSNRIEGLLKTNYDNLLKEEKILDSSYYDWKNGDITREQFQRIKKASEGRIEFIKEAVENLKQEKSKLQESINKNNDFLQTFATRENIEGLDRKLLIELIDIIYIYENKTIEIVYNFEDEYKLTLEFIENNFNGDKPNKLQLKKVD